MILIYFTILFYKFYVLIFAAQHHEWTVLAPVRVRLTICMLADFKKQQQKTLYLKKSVRNTIFIRVQTV